MALVSQLVALLALAVGFYVYIRIARRSRTDDLDGFFLGGRNINSSLFENATWGTSYALNNGIYWGIFFGYTVGFSALWINGAWALGFVGLSFVIPKMLSPTEKYTLHGFLGNCYGPSARIMASIASSTVMLFNIGAEIVFASMFLSIIFGLKNLSILLIVGLAMFSAVFCSIGGYRANAAIDRVQNVLSTASLIFVFFFVCSGGLSRPMTPTLAVLFVIGLASVALLGLAMLRRTAMTQKSVLGRFENVLLFIALMTCVAIGILTGHTPALGDADLFLASMKDVGSNTAFYISSVVLFQFAYQFVDTSNWQNISAHRISLEKQTSANPISRALRETSLKIFLAPVMLSTIIGVALRSLSPDMQSSDANFMVDLIRIIEPVSQPLIALVVLGVLTFVFVGAARSGIDSWVMAATQTLSWDILDHRALTSLDGQSPEDRLETQRRIVRRAKGLLFVLTGTGAVLYYGLFHLTGGKIVVLFNVIFSSSLTLLPALMFALYAKPQRLGRAGPWVAFSSMFAGYALPFALLAVTALSGPVSLFSFSVTPDEMYALAPYLALGTSATIFILGWLAFARKLPAEGARADG